MKRYFSKLMVVEGKVRHGDHAMKEDGTIVYVNIAAAKRLAENWKRVAKVICDTQIEIGDFIYYYSRENRILFNGILAKIEGENIFLKEDRDFQNPEVKDAFYMCYRMKTAFKVVGEVSPESKWVSEGMFFNEEELNWMVYHNDEDTFYYPLSDRDKNTNDWRTTIAIKCPNCNIFH